MPRGRMINKKISLNKTLPKVSNDARLLFTWCIPHLDCEGKMHANSSILKGVVVPYLDDYTVRKIEKCIEELSKTPLLMVYGSQHKYMKFLGFDDEQTITNKEAPSEIPEPTEEEILRHNSGLGLEFNESDSGEGLPKDKISKDKISKEKRKIRENLALSQEEINKLYEQFGKEFTEKCFDKLDNYKGANGKKYKSDYRAILNWVVNAVKENHKPKKEGRGSIDFDKYKEEAIASKPIKA